MKLPKIGLGLVLSDLEAPLCCIVHLSTQPPNVLQQVTLRPDKVSKEGLIRLGETQGDEALCWIRPENIRVVEILGVSAEADGKWSVHPIPEMKAAA